MTRPLRYHWYSNDVALSHVPMLAVSVWPTDNVPVTVGTGARVKVRLTAVIVARESVLDSVPVAGVAVGVGVAVVVAMGAGAAVGATVGFTGADVAVSVGLGVDVGVTA